MTDMMGGEWKHKSPVGRGLRIAGLAVLGVAGAGLFALAFGWLAMILWNWLMPAIFGLGTITYWQAFGVVVLAKVLFGGVGGHGGHHGGSRRHPWRAHGEGHGGWEAWWQAEGKEAFRRWRERAPGGPEETGAV